MPLRTRPRRNRRGPSGIYLRAPQPNRGAQMNLAAENATGDVLIFHHADSILTAAHVAAIETALRDPETIGGAFYRKFDGRHPRLRWLEAAGRFFTRHGGSFSATNQFSSGGKLFARSAVSLPSR